MTGGLLPLKEIGRGPETLSAAPRYATRHNPAREVRSEVSVNEAVAATLPLVTASFSLGLHVIKSITFFLRFLGEAEIIPQVRPK
jgi:hypothetical protein